MTPNETPLMRLAANGAETLSNVELISVLLTEDNSILAARRLLDTYPDLHDLARAAPIDLQALLSPGDSGRVVVLFELCRRLTREHPRERPLIASAADAAALLTDMAALSQENVRVILLDINRRVMDISTVYIGTLTASVLRPAELYRAAILRGSPLMIVAHNHPSGEPTPSPEDVELTRVLAAAGRLLDITLVDHLIIGRGKWVSLKDMGFSF